MGGCGDGAPITDVRQGLINRGVSIEELFASPEPAELESIRREWDQAALEPSGVVEERAFTLDNGDRMRVVSHLVGSQRHYGVVIVPAGDHAPASLPVAINLIGFGSRMVLEVPPEASAYAGEYVTILPSFRGHELRFGDQTWLSDGDPFDQCDGGSNDALAFLAVALATMSEAEPSRLVALGGSRGGNVAMLAAIRHAGVDGVVELAAPTNYLVPEFLDHPNLTVLYERYFVRDLLDGGDDLAEARRRMIACSPLFFAEDLPPLQAHHGTADQNVPFAQAEALAARMQQLGRSAPSFELFAYPGGDHRLAEDRETISSRIGSFLDVLPAE